MFRWLKAARAQFLTATLAPILVGTAEALRESGSVNWPLFWLALLAMASIHLGVNLTNDYFDHLSGADEANPAPLSPLAGGSRAIQEGLIPARAVLRGGLLLIVLGASLGLLLTWLCGSLLLLIGAFGVLTGYFYTAPPLRLSYRGLGELCVALDFGVLPVLGAFYVQTGELSTGALFSSLPVAFLIAAVLWANEIPDIPFDREAGKWTLPARLGPRRAAAGLRLLFVATFMSVVLLSILHRRLALLLPLVTAPAALLASLRAARDCHVPFKMRAACHLTILTHLLASLLLAVSLALVR